MVESNMNKNIDIKTVQGFGDEWHRYDQSALESAEHRKLFDRYFNIFPWKNLPPNAVGFDLGCGSGRWAQLVAPRVGHLHCIDPSSAINVAKRNLKPQNNCSFHNNSVEDMPLENNSMDFGYSLGVLHHIPDTARGISLCTNKLKKGAPFLLYLYYSFDNRAQWYFVIWKTSELFRSVISKLPHNLRSFICLIIAITVYFPLARIAKLASVLNVDTKNFPLSAYKDLSLYTMKTDALDRFGTRLEQRFSRAQIQKMMEDANLENIIFSEEAPFWCAVGTKK